MFGYTVALRDELKVKEWELYRGYYCGVCKSIGRRYGQLPRITLSYDAAFLAMLLSSLEEEKELVKRERCLLHPAAKNPVVRKNPALDYAADMMLILAYQKALDDRVDEKPLTGMVGERVLTHAYQKLKKKYPAICADVEASIRSLQKLEQQKSPSLDRTSQASAHMIEAIFRGAADVMAAGDDLNRMRILAETGRALGAWIYVMDALDDLEKDRRKKTYNPFFYRAGGTADVGPFLYELLARFAANVDLLDIRKNRGIIENVILMGMRARTDALLDKIGESREGSV
ncbi:MAG: hypothetical protein IKR59_00995 [Lachnospiraceae bacterium]|nr:hypothetical protein [Lachnospiraceae bacterium]